MNSDLLNLRRRVDARIKSTAVRFKIRQAALNMASKLGRRYQKTRMDTDAALLRRFGMERKDFPIAVLPGLDPGRLEERQGIDFAEIHGWPGQAHGCPV